MLPNGVAHLGRRQAAAAERRTIDRFAAALIRDREGDIATGIIRTITGFGAFVEIEDSGIEGLLPLGRLPQDFYDADPIKGLIKGRSTGSNSGLAMKSVS